MTTDQTIDGVPRKSLEQALKMAAVFDDGGDGADAESARGVVWILRALLDAPASEAGKSDIASALESSDWAGTSIGNKVLVAAAITELRKAAQPQGEPVACAHDWLDDGEYLIVCTKCGAKENHDPCWRDMASAPTDGTMVRLLVEFEEHSTEDADQAPTIGANNFDNDGENVWRFAGWCWSHDHFTEGKGTPVGWLPMLPDPICTPASTI